MAKLLAHAAEEMVRIKRLEAARYAVRPVRAPKRSATEAEVEDIIKLLKGLPPTMRTDSLVAVVEKLHPEVAITYALRSLIGEIAAANRPI